MLSIGSGATGVPDFVQALLDCHERIRRFVATAIAIGAEAAATDSEVVEAARRVERYFREALPRHVQDEDESVVPRLEAVPDPELQDALATMQAEHEAHQPLITALLDALTAVCAEPASAACRADVGTAATQLQVAFESHLRLEEAIVFPAIIAHVSERERGAMLIELRRRRATP